MWPVDTDNFSAYSIQISMYESADQFPHTADTHRMNEYGPEPEAPHLVSPIQAGHIYSRPEACLVTKQPAHKYSDRFILPHLYSGLLCLPCWQINLIKLSFYQITDFYRLLFSKMLSLSPSFFFLHTHVCILQTHSLLCTVDLEPRAPPSIPTVL